MEWYTTFLGAAMLTLCVVAMFGLVLSGFGLMVRWIIQA